MKYYSPPDMSYVDYLTEVEDIYVETSDRREWTFFQKIVELNFEYGLNNFVSKILEK